LGVGQRLTNSPEYVEMLDRQVRAEPQEAPALLFADVWTSYGDLTAAFDAVQAGLDDHLDRRSCIAVEASPSPLSVVAIFGTMLSGHAVMPLPTRTMGQLSRVSPRPAGALRQSPVPGSTPIVTPLGTLHLTTDEAGDPVDESIGVVLSTSGTTGTPKHVPIAHETFRRSIAALRARTGELERLDQVNLVYFPLYHLAGLFTMLLTMVTGRRVALLEKFDVGTVVDLVQTHQIRSLSVTPTIMRMLLDADVDPAKLDSVRYVRSGTAPLPPRLAAEFTQRFGKAVIQAYGQTETGGEVIGWSPEDVARHLDTKIGSVGRIRPGLTLAIVPRGAHPESAEVLPAGEVGDLWIAGVQGNGAWHFTADLASRDEDDFVWILGRADDVILCGGFNIHPLLLREVLETHEAVSQAAVVGVDDERLGQVPVAVVVPAGRDLTAAELDAWCRERVQPYEVPRRYVFVDDMPLTETGKPHRPTLQALAAGEAALAP
jgi:long-chain acyl-CoA synthetase